MHMEKQIVRTGCWMRVSGGDTRVAVTAVRANSEVLSKLITMRGTETLAGSSFGVQITFKMAEGICQTKCIWETVSD